MRRSAPCAMETTKAHSRAARREGERRVTAVPAKMRADILAIRRHRTTLWKTAACGSTAAPSHESGCVPRGRQRGAGIALMFGAAFTFASVDALANKHLSDDFPTPQLVWFRFFSIVAFMLLVFR